MTDRVQQVGLAESCPSVDEQRVVRLGRSLGDREGGRVSKPVGRPDHEGVERVLGVEVEVVSGGAVCGYRGRRGLCLIR
jgi:hypothetical protein